MARHCEVAHCRKSAQKPRQALNNKQRGLDQKWLLHQKHFYQNDFRSDQNCPIHFVVMNLKDMGYWTAISQNNSHFILKSMSPPDIAIKMTII